MTKRDADLEGDTPRDGWEADTKIEAPYQVLHDVMMAADHAVDDEELHPERRDMWRESIQTFRDEVLDRKPRGIGIKNWPESMREAWNQTVLEEIRRG